MISIITERPLSNEEKERYKNYIVLNSMADQFQLNSTIAKSNQVGFILKGYYQTTLKRIYFALYKHTRVVVKDAENKEYILSDIQDLTYSNLLVKYNDAKREYIERKQEQKKEEVIDTLLTTLGLDKIPEDLEDFLRQYAYMYDIMYSEGQPMEDKLRNYIQIKYYLEQEFPFDNLRSINPEEELMFQEISFGNSEYLEDYIYKNGGLVC